MNLRYILEKAKKLKASDVHIICNSKPMLRINKELCEISEMEILKEEDTLFLGKEILNKDFNSFMERGEVDLAFSMEGLGRYRTNIFKQQGNISIAIRRIPEEILTLEELKIPESVKSFAKLSKGLVLVTGPTGSGKSTTLASIINLINEERKEHIITLEDPIEYIHRHKNCRINQREIGKDTKTFKDALRAALREDPDIILLGEMRDKESISIALSAAETGHLVLSTLHTTGAAKTIDRIIDSFEDESKEQIRSQLSTTLKGILSQELLKGKDGKSMVVATELMIVSSAIENLIREGKNHQINSIIQTGSNLGMHSLEHSLCTLVKKDLITKDEALRVSKDIGTLRSLLEKSTL